MNDSTSNEDSEGLHDFSKDKTLEANKESTLMSEANGCDNGVRSRSDNENGAGNGRTSTLGAAFSSVLPQADSPPELGTVTSTSSNVFIENLESTNVAIAQLFQEVGVNAEVSSSSPSSCTVALPGLIEQLITLQQQQVHMGTHMWNCSPARRGRRLSISDPLKFLKSNPVEVPETLPKDSINGVSNEESINVWNQYATTAFTNELEMKTNEISVIQNGGIQHLSVSIRNEGSPSIDRQQI
ncbi:hypothetical protein P4O66_015780 [Electrophorus voltai]|uniref:Uncharacterized protein n=1 Tax=Electrophorus voltai TaxID=2609070 RepID=A0AAD8YZV2_9TELE|nr:hypothetical protein P4O66_015780 [Electrophorus voltai]